MIDLIMEREKEEEEKKIRKIVSKIHLMKSHHIILNEKT